MNYNSLGYIAAEWQPEARSKQVILALEAEE